MLKQEHVTAMGAANFARLQAAGSVEVLQDWTNPTTGRDTAISNARLAALSQECLPVNVVGNVQYEVNRNAKGWVVELVNDGGVTKTPWLPAVTDPSAVANVTVTPDAGLGLVCAELWRVGQADQVLGLDSSYQFTIGPGETAYLQLLTVPEPGALALLATGAVSLLAYAWRKRR